MLESDLEQAKNDHIGGVGELFGFSNTGDSFGSWAGLLQKPVDNLVGSSAACAKQKIEQN